jgi:methylation protein EvaC
MGEYNLHTSCRFCGKKLDKPVINLGTVPLAGGFLKSKSDFSKEKMFPLTLAFCENCYLLQTREVISKNKLFSHYYYHSASILTLVSHFKETAAELTKLLIPTKNSLIVEIGCNDGSFIRECLNRRFRTVGVDPATNVVKPLIKKGMPIINDYFTKKIAKEIKNKYGKADVIFSSNTLAHIEDLHEVFTGINLLLKNDGILIFENHYLGNLIEQTQYDMIYHEHQYYYSLNSIVNFLKQHDLEVYNVMFIPIHAGSIKIYVQKKNGKEKIEDIVIETLTKEKKSGLTTKKTFIEYNKKIETTKINLIRLLKSIKKNNKTIAGYGASGRGTIIMNYCKLEDNFLDYVIDDAPAKQGAYTPGNHLKIISSKILSTKRKPDYIVLFAWSFWEEIKKRNALYIKYGGKFIIPLPIVKII